MEELTLYQIVHTLEGRIFHLEAHLKLLFEAYYQIFGRGAKLEQAAAEAQILAVLRRSRCPKGVSLFIKLTLSPDGTLSVTEHERSLYRGYTMRCLSPRAATVECTMPYIDYPTAARDTLIGVATAAARKRQGDVALCYHEGIAHTIGGAQIFGVSPTDGLVTAAESLSVEHALAKQIATSAEIHITQRPILVEELRQLDELFFVDHYGVTSIKSCNNQYYMSIVAGALATLLGNQE
ncbi:MAG: hypothetical protein SNI45_02050 [Rikenellaceae bacterium]